jgi:hypothetical protein
MTFRRVKYKYFTSMKAHQITEVRGHYYLGPIWILLVNCLLVTNN